jgi:translation initiation factor 1
MTKQTSRTVWSSDQGDLRKQAAGPGKLKSLPPHEQTAYLHRESKGRGGKAVIVIKQLVLSEEDLKQLATKLKQVCGSGGTVKNGAIEIQGENRAKIADALKKMGYNVKIAGG